MILERVGSALAGDPYRVDIGSRVVVDLMELHAPPHELVEVGVVEETEETISSYSTWLPVRDLLDLEGWRPWPPMD
jgi:hypothetical protein